MPARSMPNTTRRCSVDVELYRWKIALRRAVQRFDGAMNQLRARLAQHLNRHVRRNAIFFDDAPNEIEVGLRRRRKAHFDFGEADFEQQIPHLQLFVDVHRIDERLIAVAQIDAAPARRLRDDAVRPLPILQIDRRECDDTSETACARAHCRHCPALLRNLLFAHGESSFVTTVRRANQGGREP